MIDQTMGNMSKKAVLILSSGGARGLAQIGVIEALESQGWVISRIAGSSIGSLVGAFYAAGKLNDFKAWVEKLDKMDVMRYFDVTISSQGFIKGDKIMKEMRRLMGNVKIEDLPVPFKAIAADIINNKSVWFENGDVINAIRASVSIPGVFTPSKTKNKMFVDGAIACPLPMQAYHLKEDEQMIAVNLNARIPYEVPELSAEEQQEQAQQAGVFHQWRENARNMLNIKKHKSAKSPGMYGILLRSFEMMQESYTMELINNYHPHFLVELSRESADTFEFNKAKELIAYGKQQTIKALNNE